MWESNYINFILEHSKITHRGRYSRSEVWGSWLWLFSHHDGDSTLSASTCHPAPLYHEETCRAETGRYGRKLVVGNSGDWAKP